MARTPDPRIERAKTRTMLEVLDKLEVSGLTAIGDERVGPCPRPGCGGRVLAPQYRQSKPVFPPVRSDL